MKSYRILQEAFRKLDTSTAAWSKSARFPKTAETANSILYRDAVVDASTLAYLGHCLGMSNKQVVVLLDEYAAEVPRKLTEVSVLKRLISPVDLTKDEQTYITTLRSLSPEKQQLVHNLVRSLS